MKKKWKIFINLLLSSISIILITSIIGLKKINISDNNFSFLQNNKIFNFEDVSLNVLEIIIIYIFVLIIIITLTNIIKLIFNICIPKKLNYIISTYSLIIVLSILVTILITVISNKYILNDSSNKITNQPYSTHIIRPVGTYEIDNNENINNKTYTSRENDTNTILIRGNNEVVIDNSKIYKYGNSSNNMSASTYGTNSAILVLKDSKLNISNTNIITNSESSSGIFAALDDSKVIGDNLNIETANKNSSGITASINSTIDIYNSKIKTSMKDSPSISSIREGKINIASSILKTNSSGSPLIYTNSIINIKDSTGDANGTSAIYMTDSSQVSIDNCDFKVSANKVNNKLYDAGIMISKDLDNSLYNKSNKINIYNSKIMIKNQSRVYQKAPMFVVNNINSIINISNNNFIYGSDIFLKIINENKSKNIRVILNTLNQNFEGEIILSNNSTIELNLTDSKYIGKINSNNNGEKVTLKIINSNLELTGDSYISIFSNDKEDYSNIISNGYTLYYDSSLNKNLNNKTIKLTDGGYIKPFN